MEKSNKVGFWLYAVGAVVVLLVMAWIIVFTDLWVGMIRVKQIAFTVGVALNIVGRVMTLPKIDNFRVKRFNAILAISALLLVASCYFIFQPFRIGYVVIMVMISAFIDLWVSIRYEGYLKDRNAEK